MPNIHGDIFPVGLVAQDASGVIQVWNGSAWVTYAGVVPTNVPRANPGLPIYPPEESVQYVNGVLQVWNGSAWVTYSGGSGAGSTLVLKTTSTYTLPTVASTPGSYTVFKSDATASGNVTVVTPDGSLINGASSYVLATLNQYATFELSGGNWYVVANN